MGLVIAWRVCQVLSNHILNRKLGLNLKRIQDVHVKRVVAQVSQTNRFTLYFGIQVDLMLEWDSRSHGRNLSGFNARMALVTAWKVDRFALYLRFRVDFKLESDLRSRRRNPSGFNARMGLVIAWKVSQTDRFALYWESE
ncbi:uncharacterized protein G2W53_015342 [Senna tora]|uniref:Uncharacterized protein n=1 Tax=Senna tora TaxID=362788 RepID=A0A835C5H1_9FABA|nr:uncharacterized protein G2W53_015342 [Senna tora]